MLYPKLDTPPGPSTSPESTSSILAVNYKKLAFFIVSKLKSQSTPNTSLSPAQMAPLASQIATLLAPGMKNNIVEGLATIIPIRPVTPHHQEVIPSNSTSSQSQSLTPIDISKVVIQPACWRELCEIMGPQTRFRFLYQACVVELCAQCQKDLIIVLGTGEGKSQLFMMCAANAKEKDLATVVIVPLILLLHDLISCLREKRVGVMEWSNTATHLKNLLF